MRRPVKGQFIARGGEALSQTSEYKQQVAAIRAAIVARYAETLQGSSMLRRPLIRWKMRREIRRAIIRLIPGDACFIALGRRE